MLFGFGEAGGEEAGGADVGGCECECLAEGGDGFGGAPVLAEELAEEQVTIGLFVLAAFDEGLSEGSAEVMDGGFWEGARDELLGGALRGCGDGFAGPAAGEWGAGGAALGGGGSGEVGVGEDLLTGDGAAVDGEELALFCDEEAGGDWDGKPEVYDGGLEGIEEFDRFRGGHFGGEVGTDGF